VFFLRTVSGQQKKGRSADVISLTTQTAGSDHHRPGTAPELKASTSPCRARPCRRPAPFPQRPPRMRPIGRAWARRVPSLSIF